MNVRYRSGCLVLILPFMLGGVALLASATFNPATLDDITELKGATWLKFTSYFVVGGVNVPVAALALFAGWELVKLTRRAWSHHAIICNDEGVTFHPTERIKVALWSELEQVRYDQAGLKSDLLFTFADGRLRRIRNCEQDDAEKFVALARSRLTPPAPAAIPPAT